MGNRKFVRHHVHSVYSTRDGLLKMRDLFTAEAAGETFSLTDHGSLGGWLACIDEAKKHGIRPILGCEFYANPNRNELFDVLARIEEIKKKTGDAEEDGELVGLKAERSRLAKYEHLVVTARSDVGAKNIIKLNNMAYTRGFYSKPMLSYDELFNDVDRDENGDDGLFVTSACLGSGVSRAIMAGEIDRAEEIVAAFKRRFGDMYMLEVQSNGIKEQFQVNAGVMEIARKLGVRVCVGVDSHYLDRDDADTHQDLLLLQNKNKRSEIGQVEQYVTVRDRNGAVSQKKIKDGEFKKIPYDELQPDMVIGKGATQLVVVSKELKPKVWTYATDIVYYKSEADVRREFSELHTELAPYADEICEANKEIDAVHGEVRLDSSVKLPHMEGGRERIKIDVAKAMSAKGLNGAEAVARVKHELKVIFDNGFEDYFLILADIMKYAKAASIPIGAARGSAGSSLVAYLLGIHRINPLEERWGAMPFGRFLDESRNVAKVVIEGADGERFETTDLQPVVVERDGERMEINAVDVAEGDVFVGVVETKGVIK